MKQTKPLSIALPLLAALELFKTARAVRPDESQDIALSLGVTPLKLKLATGNMGGGKPQPEFQGGDWEKKFPFGKFEQLLGAMVLATAKGCPPSADKGWEPATYYERYSKGKQNQDYGGCKPGAITFQGTDFEFPKLAEEILSKADLTAVIGSLGGAVPEGAGKALYGEGASLKELFTEELAKGKGFSGAEGCLKERLAFPYFEAGFMQLVEWRRNEKPDEFLRRYLMDLRGMPEDMEKLKKSVKPEVAAVLPGKRENADATFCKVKGDKFRAQVFNNFFKKDDGTVITETDKNDKVSKISLDWLSMALWDIYIVDAFVKWSKGKTLAPLVSMGKNEEKAAILRVASHFVKNVDILFVQEVGGDLCAPGKFGGEALAHCVPQETTYDSAFFLNKRLGAVLRDTAHPHTKAVRDRYEALLGEVGSDDKATKATKPSEKAKWMDKKSGVKEVSALGKVELAVAELGAEKVRVLLVSAHPDSSGVNCALQLYLAKQVFEENRGTKGLQLQFLIMGSDTNLQTDEDYKEKLKKKENGYDQKTFRAKVAELGFDVLWPEDETVHKQRTFLQTQLNKAGKHDEVRKDMLFVYPQGTVSTPVPAAKVYNTLDKNGKLGLEKDDRYPTMEWPMDHFVSTAEVTLTPVPVK